MSEEDAYQLTLRLQAELEGITRVIPPELQYSAEQGFQFTAKEDTLVWRRLLLYSLRQVICLHLHRRYYVKGWLDARFSRSRKTCSEIAEMFVSLFLVVSRLMLDVDGLMNAPHADKEDLLKRVVKRVSGENSTFCVFMADLRPITLGTCCSRLFRRTCCAVVSTSSSASREHG